MLEFTLTKLRYHGNPISVAAILYELALTEARIYQLRNIVIGSSHNTMTARYELYTVDSGANKTMIALGGQNAGYGQFLNNNHTDFFTGQTALRFELTSISAGSGHIYMAAELLERRIA